MQVLIFGETQKNIKGAKKGQDFKDRHKKINQCLKYTLNFFDLY